MVAAFVAITFLISWGLIGVYIFFPDTAAARFGARGSLLWPMLFHWPLINPFWPDAQPWDTWILVAVAVIVVWWNRDTMFTREGAVTEAVPARKKVTLRPAES